MKSLFTAFLIIGFVGVAVFGFISMIYGANNSTGCIVGHINGTGLCPQNNLANFISHLDAFKFFSKAVFIALSILVITLLSGFIFSILPKPLNDDEEDDFVTVSGKPVESLSKFKIQLIYWLSIHTNSPAITLAARI